MGEALTRYRPLIIIGVASTALFLTLCFSGIRDQLLIFLNANPKSPLFEVAISLGFFVTLGFSYLYIRSQDRTRELRIKNVELGEAVDERTQKLMKAEMAAAVGKIASMVGHDLRNPLQSIRNAAFLAKQTPERAEEMLEIIEDSVVHASNILDDLRDITLVAKPEANSVNVRSFLKHVIQTRDIPDTVNVVFEIDEDVTEVSMDQTMMRRVFDNLIKNALEAMPRGGELKVRAYKMGGDVAFEVRDTGTGIPEEVRRNLFEPFVTTKDGGMGLGLAYCKRAVEAHGGNITSSTSGDGSSFTIRIPRTTDQEP